ncbi:hypothetical protein ACNOYE_20805 [Nannocystaceae bacterium ST9]
MTTPAKYRLTGLLLVLGLSTTVACGSETKDEGTDKKDDAKKDDAKKDDVKKDDAKKDEPATTAGDAKVDVPTPDPGTTPPVNTPGAGEAGPAYFAVDDKGIVKLDGTTFTLLSGAPDKFVRDLLVGPDGSLYVLTFSELSKIEGDSFKQVFKFGFDDMGSVDALAFGKDGKYFAVSYNGVGEWANNVWTVTKKEDIGADVKLLNGVALASDGTLWVASSNDLHYKGADGKWVKADVSVLDRMPFFNSLQTSPTGDLYAQAGNYLGKVTAGTPPKIEKIEIKGTNAWGFSELSFSPDGQIGLASLSCDLVRMNPADPASVWVQNGDSKYGCESLSAVTLDGQKRMWVASRSGLNVMGPGSENVAYPSGSVLELVGNVKSIAVVGQGPALPAAPPTKKGGITGKLLMDGTAIANAKVEICPQPALFTTTTPCADSNAKFSGTSGADGTFTFADVPLGNYGVAVEIDGKWRTSWLSDFGVQMKEGATYDIGSVKFTAN